MLTQRISALLPMTPFTLPTDYPRLRCVHSFAELVGTPFHSGVNALCWERTLPGDYGEVAAALGEGDGEPILALDAERLRALRLSRAGLPG